MKTFLTIAASLAILAGASVSGAALAGDPQGKAHGHGCVSNGATEQTPGKWFQALKVNPVANGVLLGLNPHELALLENTTPGWAGYGQTPTTGALINFFCDNSPQP